MNPACDNCKSSALGTQICSEQIDNVATEFQDNQNNKFPLDPTGMDSTIVNNTSMNFSNLNNNISMETSLQLLTTNSLELTRSEPSNCELSSQVPEGSSQILLRKAPSESPPADLLRELERSVHDLSRKLDESNSICLDIRDTLRNPQFKDFHSIP